MLILSPAGLKQGKAVLYSASLYDSMIESSSLWILDW